MKCSNCRSCMRVVRVDRESDVVLARFCDVCMKAYDLYTNQEITNQELYLEIKEKYFKLKGNKGTV